MVSRGSLRLTTRQSKNTVLLLPPSLVASLRRSCGHLRIEISLLLGHPRHIVGFMITQHLFLDCASSKKTLLRVVPCYPTAILVLTTVNLMSETKQNPRRRQRDLGLLTNVLSINISGYPPKTAPKRGFPEQRHYPVPYYCTVHFSVKLYKGRQTQMKPHSRICIEG
jgi:hypothetical protein